MIIAIACVASSSRESARHHPHAPLDPSSRGDGCDAGAKTAEASSSRERLRAWSQLVIIGLLCLWPAVAAAQKKDSCWECHSALEGPLLDPVTQMSADIHRQRGFSCADCHGGDPTTDDPMESMSPRKGFIARPAPKDVPAFCGRCHSNADLMKKFNPALRVDQEREYFTSIHGKRLRTGDAKVATCIACHGAHGVRKINDPLSPVYPLNVAETCASCHAKSDYMAGYRIAHDQYDRYKRSVHARMLYEQQDLSAPTCNDCHGNHGATPPGVTSVANVCGQCHTRQSSLFQNSPHKAAFDALKLAECIQCHGNHEVLSPRDDMLGVMPPAVCIACHREGDRGYQIAEKMRQRIEELKRRLHEAGEILDRAERAGMEVSRAKFELSETRDALTHARVLVHSFSLDELESVIGPGLQRADRVYQAGQAALAELSFRRKGLGVSLFFILFLALLVYLKIRDLEGR